MVLEEVEEETSNIRVRMGNWVSEMILSSTLRISWQWEATSVYKCQNDDIRFIEILFRSAGLIVEVWLHSKQLCIKNKCCVCFTSNILSTNIEHPL